MGRLVLAFSGAKKRVELLRNSYILRGQKRGRKENQKRPPHPYLVGSEKRA